MDNKPKRTTEEYISSQHRLGRVGVLLALCVMLAIPTVVAVVYGTFPGFGPIFAASVGLLAIFLPVTISEVISYTPVMGSSIYLTLITGNIMNLKLPVVTNALKLLDVDNGSEEADVISGIAVSISSIVTLVIMTLGVLLMVPLRGVLTLPAVETASGYIVPALFGSMALGIFSDSIGGGVRAKRRLLGALVPALIVAAVFFYNAAIVSQLQGVLIIVMLPVTYFGTKFMYKKGWIKVLLPGEADEKKKPQKTA